MRSDYYWIRKKARKHDKWIMKQDSTTWKIRTQNLVATYTLILRINLEKFTKSILIIPYIILKLRKLEVQCFKQCTNQSWNEEVMAIWIQPCKVERPFRNYFEIQLMNSKSNSKLPNFEVTHYHFDASPLLPWELYLGHSIHPKWVPND